MVVSGVYGGIAVYHPSAVWTYPVVFPSWSQMDQIFFHETGCHEVRSYSRSIASMWQLLSKNSIFRSVKWNFRKFHNHTNFNFYSQCSSTKNFKINITIQILSIKELYRQWETNCNKYSLIICFNFESFLYCIEFGSIKDQLSWLYDQTTSLGAPVERKVRSKQKFQMNFLLPHLLCLYLLDILHLQQGNSIKIYILSLCRNDSFIYASWRKSDKFLLKFWEMKWR